MKEQFNIASLDRQRKKVVSTVSSFTNCSVHVGTGEKESIFVRVRKISRLLRTSCKQVSTTRFSLTQMFPVLPIEWAKESIKISYTN